MQQNNKTLFTRIAVWAMAIMPSLLSCGKQNLIPESLVGVKEYVAEIDSSVAAMYGWEPQDSTYNCKIDTQAYDDARAVWTAFKRLVDADRYDDALSFYFSEDSAGHQKKFDFLVFLKHSTQRYVFISDVLLPLMRECRGEAFATEEFIKAMGLEKDLEDATIAMNGSGYVPEVYPSVVLELGAALATAGRMEEAQALADDLARGIFGLTGDPLTANYAATAYSAELSGCLSAINSKKETIRGNIRWNNKRQTAN